MWCFFHQCQFWFDVVSLSEGYQGHRVSVCVWLNETSKSVLCHPWLVQQLYWRSPLTRLIYTMTPASCLHFNLTDTNILYIKQGKYFSLYFISIHDWEVRICGDWILLSDIFSRFDWRSSNVNWFSNIKGRYIIFLLSFILGSSLTDSIICKNPIRNRIQIQNVTDWEMI